MYNSRVNDQWTFQHISTTTDGEEQMTPKQRYLFDLTGYIHLKNVLSDEELQNAQDAVERCVQTPPG